eukprot:141971_1
MEKEDEDKEIVDQTEIDLEAIAQQSHGFVGANIAKRSELEVFKQKLKQQLKQKLKHNLAKRCITIRKIFEEAYNTSPSIIFIDELDVNIFPTPFISCLGR